MPIYQVYTAVDYSESAMYPGDRTYDLVVKDTDGREMPLVAEFWARGYDEARDTYLDILFGDA